MKRSFVVPAVLGALLAIPGSAVAAPTCASGQTPGAPPLYCIPPAPPATAAAAASSTSSAGIGDLSALTPAELVGKPGLALPASASGPGSMTIILSAKVHGKTVVIGSGKKTFGSAGTSTIQLSLTKAGKVALKHHKGALKVTLTATFKPTQGKSATAKSKATLK